VIPPEGEGHGNCVKTCVLLAFSVTTFAQSPTGEIAGVVKDPTGAVVPSAEIVVINQNTAERKTALTNDSGQYVAPLLPVGVYTVTAGMPGFRTVERRELTLSSLRICAWILRWKSARPRRRWR
jgi:hypothetical protein